MHHVRKVLNIVLLFQSSSLLCRKKTLESQWNESQFHCANANSAWTHCSVGILLHFCIFSTMGENKVWEWSLSESRNWSKNKPSVSLACFTVALYPHSHSKQRTTWGGKKENCLHPLSCAGLTGLQLLSSVTKKDPSTWLLSAVKSFRSRA